MSQHKLRIAEPTGYSSPYPPLIFDPSSSTNRVLTREGKTLESRLTHDSGGISPTVGRNAVDKKEKNGCLFSTCILTGTREAAANILTGGKNSQRI